MADKEKRMILTSLISVFDLSETAKKISELAKDKNSHYVCVSNVHTVVEGFQNPQLAHVTNHATLATADGVPLIWASKMLYQEPIHGRASGPDILIEFIKNSKYSDLSHYFYGSTPQVLKKIESEIKSMNPAFRIAGTFSPPVRTAASLHDTPTKDEIFECENIQKANPDIIWVGLGAPKQEIWMYRMRSQFKKGVLVGVGAAFDFISGNKKRAPRWMQKSGLEWLHRMSTEPKRLFTRYARTNPIFVREVIKQAFKKNLS